MRSETRTACLTALLAVLVFPSVSVPARPALEATAQPSADSPGQRLQQDGIAAFGERRLDDAERLFIAALAAFEESGDIEGQAAALRNLTFLPRLPGEQRIPLVERALALAVTTDNAGLTGAVRHQLSDLLFLQGDLAGAFSEVDAAIPLLESRADRAQTLARALTSRGRLFRTMGRLDEAMDDQARAAAILEKLGDLVGAAQAHHGRALSYAFSERLAEAIAEFDVALGLARMTGDSARLPPVLAQAAVTHVRDGRPELGLRLLREADALPLAAPSDRAVVDLAWTQVLLALDRPAEALARVDRALERDDSSVENQFWRSWAKAYALDRLGRQAESLQVAQQAVALGDDLWRRMVPLDAAKRGLAGRHDVEMSWYVRRLWSSGRREQALEMAERARGRAFLDLLASADLRLLQAHPVPRPPVTAAAPSPLLAPEARATPPERVEALLTMRGAGLDARARTPEPAISSVATAEPPGLDLLVAQAARLQTHLLCYWVTSDATLVWVVAPDGRTTTREVLVSQPALAALIEQTLPDVATPTRGANGRLTIPGDAAAANRELYRRLVTPVAGVLPLHGRGLITIVPHGPLYRLSFAALLAPSGRYLVEQTALHYSPSVSALAFTETRRTRGSGPVLVVANPAVAPGSEAASLPALPGAVEEGRLIARALGESGITLLSGGAASERAVRDAAPNARALHFAAHGVIHDDNPFGSFLALAGSGRAPDSDGRLTMGEVYGLRLNAGLVVLSGCRTAVGPVTGEGMIGLTRGFFAAGAPSVVASLWDVSDTVTASLFSRFYREWPARLSKAEALRRSQMQLIADLRAGRKHLDTPAGRFTLPEHPSLWAGLILVGEP